MCNPKVYNESRCVIAESTTIWAYGELCGQGWVKSSPKTAPQSYMPPPVAQTACHRGHVLAPGRKYFRTGNHASEILCSTHNIYDKSFIKTPRYGVAGVE